MSFRILLVEDEPGLVLTLSDLLTGEGYAVESATDGPSGLKRATDEEFDLIILDVMLPGKSGLDVCRELRQHGRDTAILMLTAKTQLVDRVVGLKLGADDYLTKPFEPPELLARMEALLRRVKKENMAPVTRYRFGSVDVDFDTADVKREGVPVALAGKELELLRYLVRSSRQRGIARRTPRRRVEVSARRLLEDHRCARRLAAAETGRQPAGAAPHPYRARSGLPLRAVALRGRVRHPAARRGSRGGKTSPRRPGSRAQVLYPMAIRPDREVDRRVQLQGAAMSTTTYTDVLLMVQVRDGQDEVFDVLVERYRNDLVGYLYRSVQNHAIAEELAQETFMRAYRSRAGYQPTAKFSTWLYAIGTRLAWNWIRDNRTRRRQEPLEGTAANARPRQFTDPCPLIDETLEHAECVRAVKRAVAELPDRQRAAVLMHKYQDMTYEEIAAVSNCTPQAVKSLLFRAHSALRGKLVRELRMAS